MERDFLGVVGKETVKDEPRGGSRQDAAMFGVPAMQQWPFSASKASPMPPFVSFKPAPREEEPKDLVFDQFSISGFRPASTADAFDSSKKQTSHVLVSQKPLVVDGQSNQHYAMHGHRPQNTDSFSGPNQLMNGTRMFPVSSNHSIPFAPTNPLFNVRSNPNLPNVTVSPLRQQPFSGAVNANNPVMGSTVGVYAPRDVLKPPPKTAQLTIFYAGSVNVFDNIPLEKAQELMLLASKASVANSAFVNQKMEPKRPIFSPSKVVESNAAHTPQLIVQKQDSIAPPCSRLSSPISVTSQTGTLSRSASSCNTDTTRTKSACPLAPASQPEPASTQPAATVSKPAAALATTTAATVVSRAVPQARKASLARFLEKRKERVASVVPYPLTKNSETSDTGGSANMQSKSSCIDITLSSNYDEPLSSGQRNSSYSGESLCTKLQI